MIDLSACDLITIIYKELETPELRILGQVESAESVIRAGGLGFDLDGSEIDTHTPAVAQANRRLANTPGYKDKTVDDITLYNGYFSWFEAAGLDDHVLEAMLAFHTDEVLLGAEHNSGFLLLSEYLDRKEINIPRITSRPSHVGPYKVAKNTHKWFEEKAPYVIEKDLLHIQSEGSQIRKGYKVSKINELGLAFFFEDSVEHARDIVASTDATVILVPQNWNSEYEDDNSRIIRTGSRFADYPKAFQAYFALIEHITKVPLI